MSKTGVPVDARVTVRLNASPLFSAGTLYSRLLAVRPAVAPGLQGQAEQPGSRQPTANIALVDCLSTLKW